MTITTPEAKPPQRFYLKGLLFFCFFVSGFCGLLYQIVWMRIAFASFGVILPVMSVVISVFMLGLSLGAWAGGKWIPLLRARSKKSAIMFYGCAELMIGCGAFIVPKLFIFGEKLLLPLGGMESFSYLALSALVLGISIFPWCMAMGVTFPFMMAFIEELKWDDKTGFSFLYLANVIGALFGTLLTALVLVEILGFSGALLTGAFFNFIIGLIFLRVARSWRSDSYEKLTPVKFEDSDPRGASDECRSNQDFVYSLSCFGLF
ncbi:MAG: hypothetical protein IIA62_10225 [Nitrospinae bacterium]|nr:hypothetical protein [Nitrospinota bacterium]